VIALPIVILGLVVLHILALHEVGSNNPDGVDIKKNKDANGVPVDGIAFHPYYTVKDIVGVVVFLMVVSVVIFFEPTFGGLFLEHANFTPADPLLTPPEIAPVWYFTPFYAILRAVPNKLFGVILMGLAVMSFFFLPWLDRGKVLSIRYRGWIYKTALTVFALSFLGLGYLGTQPVTTDSVLGLPITPLAAARILAVLYFGFFLLMPIYTRLDPSKPVPERLT
jgi:ubiquinol-cytochrome c reductase cytochrome b subunit